MNARVIAVDINAQRLQRAREFGADLIDPAKVDALEALRD
jgi:threonine dehydrogenase-like Zn-dependent dehydrogenase